MPYQPTQNYYYQTPAPSTRSPLLGLKGRPVTGLEEVRAAAIDQEELIADLIASYGEEIIEITNKIFNKIKG